VIEATREDLVVDKDDVGAGENVSRLLDSNTRRNSPSEQLDNLGSLAEVSLDDVHGTSLESPHPESSSRFDDLQSSELRCVRHVLKSPSFTSSAAHHNVSNNHGACSRWTHARAACTTQLPTPDPRSTKTESGPTFVRWHLLSTQHQYTFQCTTTPDLHISDEPREKLSIDVVRECLVLPQLFNLRSHRTFVHLRNDLLPQLLLHALHRLDILDDLPLSFQSSHANVVTLDGCEKSRSIPLRLGLLERSYQRGEGCRDGGRVGGSGRSCGAGGRGGEEGGETVSRGDVREERVGLGRGQVQVEDEADDGDNISNRVVFVSFDPRFQQSDSGGWTSSVGSRQGTHQSDSPLSRTRPWILEDDGWNLRARPFDRWSTHITKIHKPCAHTPQHQLNSSQRVQTTLTFNVRRSVLQHELFPRHALDVPVLCSADITLYDL
jgi:hypothetical protein